MNLQEAATGSRVYEHDRTGQDGWEDRWRLDVAGAEARADRILCGFIYLFRRLVFQHAHIHVVPIVERVLG